MTAYYNEIDPYAAEWLRTLIMMGHIADGVVDTRSISEIEPNDLRGFTQCHFFAGIGVWSYALRIAGWPDDRPVWTGSCPCQPFSSAGRSGGFADERHLWPHFHHLIRECHPGVVFGEQVASKDGLAWLDLVHADLEATGYAAAAVDLCAAGVGAPHIRQRLYWVADAVHAGRPEWRAGTGHGSTAWGGRTGSVADDDDEGLEGLGRGPQAQARHRAGSVRPASARGELGRLADPGRQQCQRGQDTGRPDGEDAGEWGEGGRDDQRGGVDGGRPGPTDGFWRTADWLLCQDGKWRPVEPGTFPLAHGAPARVGRLRAYGNAIVAQCAAEVIGAYMDVRA